jgi:thioredoxin 1
MENRMGQWSRDADSPPFIDLVPVERATGARKAVYDEVERVRGPGRVSNLFKAYAAFPELAKANFQRLNVLLTKGSLSVKFKEALMTALAEANKCDYCVSFHATQLRNAGASDAEVKGALEFDPDRIGLSAEETALFNYALKANGDPHSIRKADIDELRKAGATDQDMIETLETVSTGNSFNLINGALNVGPDDFLSYMKDRGEVWKKLAQGPAVVASLTELSSPNELGAAMRKPGLLMLDIYTQSCVICRRMEPMVAAVAGTAGGAVRAHKVDAERLTDFAVEHNIQGVPTVLLFRDGRLLDRKSGFLTASALRDWIAAQPHA